MVNETINYLQIYSNITKDPYGSAAEDDEIALTGVKNVYFPALKEWILSFVNSNKVWSDNITKSFYSSLASSIFVNTYS